MREAFWSGSRSIGLSIRKDSQFSVWSTPLERSTLPASNLRQEARSGQLIAVDLRKEVISLPAPHSLLPQALGVPVLLIWCTCQAMIKPPCCFSILPLSFSRIPAKRSLCTFLNKTPSRESFDPCNLHYTTQSPAPLSALVSCLQPSFRLPPAVERRIDKNSRFLLPLFAKASMNSSASSSFSLPLWEPKLTFCP